MKNILITGASEGIGKALALKYASLGNNLVLAARNLDALTKLTNELKQYNIVVLTIQTDVTDKDSARNCVNKAIEKLGKIDIAILNAGISGSESFVNFTTEQFRRIYDTNVFGILHFIELLVPIMIHQGSGVIAGVGSMADSRGFRGSAAYCSSKIALSHILESARVDLKQYGIDVINIRPGFVKTNMTDKNKFPMPFMISANQAAEIIYNGIKKRKRVISFPLPTYILTTIAKYAPNFLFDYFSSKVNTKEAG